MLKNKKLFVSLLILIPLVIISWSVLLDYSTKRLENRLAIITAELKQKGYLLSYSKLKITGNPLSMKAVFQDPHIKDPNGLFEWQGQEVEVSMQPWEFYTLKCLFPGEQKIAIPQNAFFSLGILKFEGAKGTINLTSKGGLKAIDFMAGRLSSFVNDQVQPFVLESLSLKLQNLTDPLNSQISFTTQISQADTLIKKASHDHPFTVIFDAQLSGLHPQKPLLKSLADWRDKGGILEVNHLKLTWMSMEIEAEGTLTFDKEMYPLGSFSSRIMGFHQALDGLVELGWVKSKNAAAASFVLGLLTSSDETGQKPLTIPITLQNKALLVGPARLFKFRPIKSH